MSSETPQSDYERKVHELRDALAIGNVIDISGDIVPGSEEAFKGALNVMQQSPGPLVIRMNTYGGEHNAAIQMCLALSHMKYADRDQPRTVYCLVDGACQSAGMFMLSGAHLFDGVYATPHSQLAFHFLTSEQWAGARASQEFFYELLLKAGLMARDPARTWESWLEDIRASRMYSAEQALEAGLIDGIIDLEGDSTI